MEERLRDKPRVSLFSSLQVMRFMDDEFITGAKEFAVGNYLVQMVSITYYACVYGGIFLSLHWLKFNFYTVVR